MISVDGGPDQDFELLAGIAAEAEFSTSFEPFILVGVKTEDRYKQLTPKMSRMPGERLKENFGERVVPGGAEKFRQYLSADVLPWATKRYRTDRKVLTAASLGGLFVLDTFLERPDMFDDYIVLTPSLWWDEGRIVDEAALKLARHGASNRRLYVTMGDEGVGNRTATWLSSLLNTLKTRAPQGLKWAFVDRSGSEAPDDGADQLARRDAHALPDAGPQRQPVDAPLRRIREASIFAGSPRQPGRR